MIGKADGKMQDERKPQLSDATEIFRSQGTQAYMPRKLSITRGEAIVWLYHFPQK